MPTGRFIEPRECEPKHAFVLRRKARTIGFVVRVLSLTIILAVSYSSAVSKLRRPFISNQYFFITVRLLKRRAKLTERVAMTRFLCRGLFGHAR